MGSSAGGQRLILLAAVRQLISTARSERAALPADGAERQFMLGVDAACMDVLHPALGCSRSEDWLDRQQPAFREGYLRTALLLATAIAAPETPLSLPLPVYAAT